MSSECLLVYIDAALPLIPSRFHMNVYRASQNDIWPRRAEFHVLTYAEEGFAPLNIHTRNSDIAKEKLVEFAMIVNERNEGGTLYPSLPVSAVPRVLIRGCQDENALRKHIEAFFRANLRSIQSKKLLFDFRSPNVPQFVLAAIGMAVTCSEASLIDELVIVDDNR